MDSFISKGKNLIGHLVSGEDRPILSEARILNEAINRNKRCIFIAIPKTGTSSVRVQLREEGKPLIPNAHLDIQQVRQVLHFEKLRTSLGRNRSFPSDSVVLSNKEILAEAEEEFRSLFKFSAVRNPWARAVSLYYRNEGVRLKDKMSFKEFCAKHRYASDTCLHPTLHKNQFDWLCDDQDQLLMDYVYKTEDFEKAIGDIEEMTQGRIILKNIRENKNPDSKSSNYREMYDDETRKIIQQHFEKDIDMFKFTF
ncbi:MAG: hypothetical protein HKO93_03730 [Flavobacteriales bacterium]|nr:hypothetical protein [Flavobacteriales bacterium]